MIHWKGDLTLLKYKLPVIFLLLTLLSGLTIPAHAAGNVQVVSDEAGINFPETIQFSAEFKAGSNINSIVLEYGVDQLTCGNVQARAFPDITPGQDVKAAWTWEMRQSGSLPPGSSVWWQWLVTRADGTQFTSPKKTIEWLDSTHPWKIISGGNINLHYYDGDASFGQALHDAAVSALGRLSTDIGLKLDKPVDFFIYGSQSDMLNAVLYQPSWAGGIAFPDKNIILIEISPDILDWGKSTEAHELTHVVVGHLTFSCLGFMPTWLDEGLAMYGEGGLTSTMQSMFDTARGNDSFPSLRSLIGGFSEESDRANLSYGEAYSVVNFMIKTYGQDKMINLLKDLRDGTAMDTALRNSYGFDTDGLDAAWRKSINLPAKGGEGQATPVSTPTIVPTFVPIGAVPVAQVGASTPHPTEIQPAATQTPVQGQGPAPTPIPTDPPRGIFMPGNIATILEIGGACLVIVLLLVGLPVFFALRRKNRRPQ
jgi:hypothetical protein